MILVVDANVVIAALIRNSKAREILLSGKFKFLAPDFVKEETFKYLEYVKQKSGMGEFSGIKFETCELIVKTEKARVIDIISLPRHFYDKLSSP